MPDLIERVRDAIERHHLVTPGQMVVVGVSGGPDSLCLLHTLYQLAAVLSIHLHVGHLNHGIRADDADADAAFVLRLAEDWQLPATLDRADVPALARTHKLALEEAARCARYVFLARLARQLGAPTIAVGHNADDQAETVLMHWLRGSGLSGLRGMLPATPLADYRLIENGTPWAAAVPRLCKDSPLSTGPSLTLIRPLLDITRAEIEAYCREHDLHPRLDRSNLDTTYFRNRLRHELIPYLETYNPNIRQIVRHSAEVITADCALLRGVLDIAWEETVRFESADTVVFDLTAWRALSLSLQRSTIRQAIHRLRHALRNINFVHVENALEIASHGETGSQATLPQGLLLTVGYDTLTIAAQDYRELPDLPLFTTAEPVRLAVPGHTPLGGTAWVLHAELMEPGGMAETAGMDDKGKIQLPSDERWQATLDAGFVGRAPRLRPRRAGDRFCPFGMGGRSKRVNEFMINEKIPAAWRDHIPLLVNEDDQIAWVCGWRPDERARVVPATRQVVRLWFERVSEGERDDAW
jgi:tRNA(Ile)-lysidine synthase